MGGGAVSASAGGLGGGGLGGGGVRVLIAGIPRSGTTWVGRVLGMAENTQYVHEPDNHHVRPEAWSAKRHLGSYPKLVPGEAAPEYGALFETAFAGGCRPSLRYTSARIVHRVAPGSLRRAGPLASSRPPVPAFGNVPRNVVVKSVFCARSLEWLAERFAPTVVVLRRHPFAVIASWEKLGWDGFLDRNPHAVEHCADVFGVGPPRRSSPWIDRAAWHCGYLSSLLDQAVARHPEWLVVGHETLCARPAARFRALGQALGLGWTEAAESFLSASNRRGLGYSTNRVWAEEVDGWRTKLPPGDQERVVAVLEQFPGQFHGTGVHWSRPACDQPSALDTVRSLALSRVEC